MVHRAVFATPLGTVGTSSFRVARVIEGFFEDTPLHGGIVAVVHRQVFFHRPGEGTVVENDVVDVLYVEFRHALVRQVAGTEADMAHDAVRGQFHLVSSNADATARRCLSGNGQIRLQSRESRSEINGSCHFKQYRSWCIVTRLHCPAESSLHEVVVSAVVQTSNVIHLRTTIINGAATGGEAPISLSTRETDEIGIIVFLLLEDGLQCHIVVNGKGVATTNRQLLTAAVLPADKLVSFIGNCCYGNLRTRGVFPNIFADHLALRDKAY